MLLLFTVILITLTGVIQASEDCEGGLFSSCTFTPLSFPESEEELDILCRGMISHLECVIDYQERCSEVPVEPEVTNGVLATFRYICDNGSILNAVVVENLQCYKSVFDDDDISTMCNFEYPSTERRKQYNQALIQAGFAAFEGNETITCVASVYVVSCYALQLKKCGKAASEASIEIAHKFINGSEKCGRETADVIPAIIEVIMQEDELAENIGEALKKKK